MPSASVITVASVNSGFLASVRSPKCRSRRRNRMSNDYKRAKNCFLFAAKAIGLIELLAQLGCAEILPNMRQALFKCFKRSSNRLGIRVSNVAPHGKGAGSKSSHLAQSPAAHVLQL